MRGFERFQVDAWTIEGLTHHVGPTKLAGAPRPPSSRWMTRIAAPIMLTAAAVNLATFGSATSQARVLLPPEIALRSAAYVGDEVDLLTEDPEIYWPLMIAKVQSLKPLNMATVGEPPTAF